MLRTLTCIALTLLLASSWVAHAEEEPDPKASSRRPSVRGRVIDANTGRGVAGVRVLALSTEFGRRGDAQTMSGDDGAFALPQVPIGGVFICAYGRDWISKGIERVTFDDPKHLFHRLEPKQKHTVELLVVRAAQVSGRVVDHHGQPVSGAEVRLTLQAMPGWLHLKTDLHTVKTDKDGRYRYGPLIPGQWYQLHVDAEGSAGSGADFTADVANRTIDIRLPVPRWARVRVVDEQGRPVAGATVEFGLATPKDVVYPPYSPIGKQSTQEDGTVRYGPLPPGQIGVRVIKAGFLREPVADSYRDIEVSEATDSTAPLNTIALSRGLAIAGQVVDAEGSPQAGLEVTAAWQGDWEGVPPGGRSSTGEDGRFTIRTLPAGTYQLRVRRPGEYSTLARARGVEAGTRDVELTVADAESRAGPKAESENEAPPLHTQTAEIRIRGPDGKPVPSSRAGYHAADMGSYGPGDGGQRTITLMLRGHKPTFWVGVTHARTEGGAPLPLGAVLVGPYELGTKVVEVTLPPEKTISGQVRDADGRGVAGIRVSASLRDPYDPDRHIEPHAVATTDAKGQFTLRQLGPVTYDVAVMPNQGRALPRKPMRVSAGTSGVEIDLPRTVHQEVRISNYATSPNSMPVAMLIDLDDSARIVASAGIAPDGSGRFQAAAAGRYALWVMPQGDLSYFNPSVELSDKPLTITLVRGKSISGRLKGAVEGEHVRVAAKREDGLVAFGHAHEDGTYDVRGLPPGRWTVAAVQHVDGRTRSAKQDVEAGERCDLDLQEGQGR